MEVKAPATNQAFSAKLKKIFARTEISALIALLAIALLTGIANKAFFTASSIINLFRAVALDMVPCIGITFCLASGEIDLSSGSMVALSGIIVGGAQEVLHWATWPAVFAAVAVGVIGGIMAGFIICQFNIPPMIATLGMQQIYTGLVNVVTGGRPYALMNPDFNKFGSGNFLGIPYSIYVAAIFVLIGYFVMNHTTLGRSFIAVGGNAETARLAGISSYKHKLMVHALAGGTFAVGGIIYTARMGSANINVGASLQMNAIAACVIGGTSIGGGSPTVFGTVIGLTLMTLLMVALTYVKVDVYWQKVVLGVIIVGAVAIDTAKRASMLNMK